MKRNTRGRVVLFLLIGVIALLLGCENPAGSDSAGEGGLSGDDDPTENPVGEGVLTDGVLTIDFGEPDIPQLVFLGAVEEVPAGEELTLTLEGTFSGHRWFLNGSVAHPALSSAGDVATVDTGLINHGVHTVSVIVAEGSSGQATFSVVDFAAE